MEDYLEFILYAVLAIIGILSSGFNKKRKERKVSNNLFMPEINDNEIVADSKDHKLFPDYFDNFFQEEKEDEVVDGDIAEDIPDTVKVVDKGIEEESKTISKEFNPIYDDQIGAENGDMDFDLEQAVIYSTILKTKHF